MTHVAKIAPQVKMPSGSDMGMDMWRIIGRLLPLWRLAPFVVVRSVYDENAETPREVQVISRHGLLADAARRAFDEQVCGGETGVIEVWEQYASGEYRRAHAK